MKNIKKDIERGRGSASLADGVTLYDNTDDSHVKRTTALDTKMRQMKAASELGIDPQREKSTSSKRGNKDVKPI